MMFARPPLLLPYRCGGSDAAVDQWTTKTQLLPWTEQLPTTTAAAWTGEEKVLLVLVLDAGSSVQTAYLRIVCNKLLNSATKTIVSTSFKS